MRARLVGLAVLMLVGVALIGCGSGSTGLPGGGDPPAEVDTVTVGMLSVGVSSAAGFKTMTLPSSGDVGFTALHGTEIVRLQELRRGAQIAYMSNDGDYEISVMNADGSGRYSLTDDVWDDYEPAWSPDGTNIAYRAAESGDWGIWVMSADGSGKTPLTDNAVHDKNPAWSPDGTRIAYQSDDGGDNEIWVMKADGSGQTQLTDNSVEDYDPAWSPDGTRIAYAGHDGNDTEIRVMKHDGTGQTALTNNSTYDLIPAWSPDGSLIAYQAYDHTGGTDYEIYTVKSDGTGLTNLTDNTAEERGCTWSPDGSQIAYRGSADGARWDIYMMNADGSDQRNVTDDAADDVAPDWCPAPGVWRTLIGKVASDGGYDPPLGAARPCAVVAMTDEGLVSTASVTMNRSQWGSLAVDALTGLGNKLAGLKATGPAIKAVKEDMGRGLPPHTWNVRETPATGAVLVYFSSNTGKIVTVLASADEAITGGDMVANGGRLVVRGEFTDVLTAADPTRNLATGSMREVVLDSDTGEVVGVH